MAKKTVIKRALKYAPISTDFQKALSMDETIKTELSVDMSEIQNQRLPGPEQDVELALEEQHVKASAS